MNDKNNITGYIIAGLVIFGIVFAVVYINNRKNSKNLSEFYQPPKNYKINEYIPMYVSDNDMAKIYVYDFINKVITNPEESYNLIDVKYRNAKYPTYQSYHDGFAVNIDYSFQIAKFFKRGCGSYLCFGVYDSKDNLFIFKTNGVMQYSVYLDDYSVEIR